MTIPATSRDAPGAVAGVVLLNKPFGALCQFTGGGARATLRDFVTLPDVYPAGRLDADRWSVGRWTRAGLAPGESRIAAVL